MIPNTYNAYGYDKGRMKFRDWAHSSDYVAYKLRTRYKNRGLETIEQIGHVYAGGSTTWAGKVRYFINQFEREEQYVRDMHLYL